MRRLNDEDGAVAVIVALCLGLGFFGFAAIVIDVGDIFVERRELQNGANASALALATTCAEGTGVGGAIDCANAGLGGDPQPSTYANDNSKDGRSAVPSTIPHGADPETCDLSENAATDINPLLGTTTVKVTTETIDANTGNNSLRHFFAPLIGTPSTTVRACAVATVLPAVSADGFPLGVCQNLWDLNRPTALGPGPTIDVRYKGTAAQPPDNDCDDGTFATGSNPGNFSWLSTSGGECTTEYDFSGGDYSATGDPGANLNADCADEINTMIAEIQAHKNDPLNNDLPVRVLPIYSTVTDSGTNATYTLVTLGAFEFSGLKTRAGQNIVVNSWSDPLCTGMNASHLCVQGRFVQEVALDGAGQAGLDSDVLTVQLTN